MPPLPAFVQESPSAYSRPLREPIYEIFLGAGGPPDWLGDLPGAHRLVQTLLKGEMSGRYELLDFLIWPDGLLARFSLGQASLPGLLGFLKDHSVPSSADPRSHWNGRLERVRLVPPRDLPGSQASFLHAAERIRALSPGLFFLYQKSATRP